ncbi:DNA mismatch repair protein MutS [Natrialba magadii ATCC 43099]|uniref:DNA mismatch repair protein MutS n=1 Tax=Natrialba magadii (strain ATCC 43099 / DSM 3394 / CCM 3739 / CIP 104546 / IAM 13178 / JCM 8861 / NBRC 102185 / NCIMB 2190 / MS3) TaxID=547559 RepID=D3SS20_NATMM|nr:DNA mismatch repair protein [Natrialba magadii]ADD04746.1 DNA mismatch repair protein MutS [Natrialba magadii ATCC 43099]ELY24913.1 DNA mismatch repair protein MutS [Natrialba magadii ATCC 43099]
MRLEEYWGVGPKTRETLVSELGRERAIQAIESGDVRELATAGLARGRATRILRRATGGDGIDMLATSDARAAYKDLLDLAVEHAVTQRAADRIRVLTPLTSREEMESRLDDVLAARDAWATLEKADREAVLAAYERYDERDESERAAVETALALLEAGVDSGPFETVAELERDTLTTAADALSAFADDGGQGRLVRGADDELDRLRDALGTVEDMDANALELIEELRDDGVRDVSQFREAFEDHLLSETAVTVDQVREAMPTDATDATDFVGSTLRTLRGDLTAAIDEREEQVAGELQAELEDARDAIDQAVAAVDDIALHLSLARFALAYDCTRPTFVEGESAAVSVVNARNLTLASPATDSNVDQRDGGRGEGGDQVQPITYALGEHGLTEADAISGRSGIGTGVGTGTSIATETGVGTDTDGDDGSSANALPGRERVSVLTGANSGGKTTLLETCCQVVLLASMGLPVPAERAEVTPVDSLVFHRRHASFNAGVLESTLRSVVPPLSSDGRTLMLVDEFEAITEPGSAADLLHGLVTLTVERDALGVFVTHLADDLEPLPPEARVDGIFAEGLSPELELLVDYQPRFDTVGRSTPEFIVSRLVANADDRAERAGFETLGEAVGNDVVQRTLADARWSE